MGDLINADGLCRAGGSAGFGRIQAVGHLETPVAAQPPELNCRESLAAASSCGSGSEPFLSHLE